MAVVFAAHDLKVLRIVTPAERERERVVDLETDSCSAPRTIRSDVSAAAFVPEHYLVSYRIRDVTGSDGSGGLGLRLRLGLRRTSYPAALSLPDRSSREIHRHRQGVSLQDQEPFPMEA